MLSRSGLDKNPRQRKVSNLFLSSIGLSCESSKNIFLGRLIKPSLIEMVSFRHNQDKMRKKVKESWKEGE